MSLQDQFDGSLFLEWMHHPVTSGAAKNLEREIKNTTTILMAACRGSSDAKVCGLVSNLDCLYRFYNLMTEAPEREKHDDDGKRLDERAERG